MAAGEMVDQGFVAGGYFIARYGPRDDGWMDAGLLPPRLVSACDCLVARAPGVWAVRPLFQRRPMKFAAAASFSISCALRRACWLSLIHI